MRVILNEQQFNQIILVEGFELDNKNGEIRFNPKHNKNADTSIFKQNDDGSKEFNLKRITLPKSGVNSYNLYQVNTNKVFKPMKHGVNIKGEPMNNKTDSMEHFYKRSAFYIYTIIKNFPTDYIVSPQSSSSFNQKMMSLVHQYVPNKVGTLVIPELLVKNPKNITVNRNIAKSLGLTPEQITSLENRVEKWKKDEDIRSIRHKIEQTKQEIANLLTGKKGRPSKDVTDKRKQIDIDNQQIKLLRSRGKDPTIDKQGNVKDWQIKALDDKDRKAIENIFSINPQYTNMINKLVGKNIVIFDDNISSGATMDDACLTLKQNGVKNIIVITLGTIDPTHHDRRDYVNK